MTHVHHFDVATLDDGRKEARVDTGTVDPLLLDAKARLQMRIHDDGLRRGAVLSVRIHAFRLSSGVLALAPYKIPHVYTKLAHAYFEVMGRNVLDRKVMGKICQQEKWRP